MSEKYRNIDLTGMKPFTSGNEEYCQRIREDVIKVFEEGQPCPALPI